ncbi:hypothetical protein HNR46_002169 [Haloferula luteola]|uniref:Ice-binding protein C-terminal domain-containing protein n=1 Tax=Haloferula luteola TaxID=595692 RepID=A0A840VDH7_9BACT|nr:PEP-CTERM sorting domain-containing protein [Haloferula luteola]MBB5351930.1 hypothetical protein [Haloferula luteola]
MKTRKTIAAAAVLLGTLATAHATVIGFGQIGGNNTTVPSSLGSNATADGSGFVVTNGTTPNISLTWDGGWDIHTSGWFDPIEGQTVGGGDWDNEGGISRIGQLDFGTHTIAFAVEDGYSLVLGSFDFGHTAETAGTTSWDITLTDSSLATVWSTTVNFTNGQVETISPNFTGDLGEDYTLTFNRTSESYGSNGRHALDNLSFTQVPEPSAVALLGLAGMGCLLRRRK